MADGGFSPDLGQKLAPDGSVISTFLVTLGGFTWRCNFSSVTVVWGGTNEHSDAVTVQHGLQIDPTGIWLQPFAADFSIFEATVNVLHHDDTVFQLRARTVNGSIPPAGGAGISVVWLAIGKLP